MIEKSKLKKSRRTTLIKNAVTFFVLAIGVLVLCGFLAIIQNISAERSQKSSSERILEEVEISLRDNDHTVNEVLEGFNEINQTTLGTLAQYVSYIDVMEPLKNASGMTEAESAIQIKAVADELKEICGNIGVEGIMVVGGNGNVVIGSDLDYMGQNVGELNKDGALLSYTKNEAGEVTRNGTYYIEDGKTYYTPVLMPYGDINVYIYTSYFGTDNGNDYFVMTYVPSTIIDSELGHLKSIESVLGGYTVGKSGFLFAVDSQAGTFEYFNDGQNVLTGEGFEENGMTKEAAQGSYAGYQTIKGVTYYCVTREFKSATYGEFTVIAAVVSQEEILLKNVFTIIFSSVAFLLLAAIAAGYGLILRRDVANTLLMAEEKHKGNLKEDALSNNYKFTDEEIDERVKILIDQDIYDGKDKKLHRRNLGIRNGKGVQRYFSPYIFGKMSAVVAVGLVAIFFISYFGQTLLGLNDATSISSRRLDEIVTTLKNNDSNSQELQSYVDNEYLSKAKLISYMLEETPEVISIGHDEKNVHRVLEKDENGNNVPLFFDDYPTAPRYALSKSPALQEFCDNNGIKTIYVFADDGKVMATNTDLWYFTLSKNPEDQSYIFNDIIDDKVDHVVQEKMEGEATGEINKYIGTEFFYYTYLEDGNVALASKTDYESFVAGTWAKADITKHRSLLQIGVDEKAIEGLFSITSMDYILSNMHVYGENSFFMTFDTSEEHIVTYSPFEGMIGKKAEAVGLSSSVFMTTGTYNGFQKINGQEYYQTVVLMDGYYIATAIPTSSVYAARDGISWYTLLFSSIFIILASAFFTVSSDKADEDYCNSIKYKDKDALDNAKGSFVLSTPSGKKRRTTSAVSRFSRIAWAKKTPEEKLSAILMIYLTFASLFILISLIFALSNKEETIFSYIFSGVWERGFNVFAVTESIMIMIIVITITRLAQAFVRSFCSTLGARVETTGNLIVSVLKYGGVIGGVFYCLYLFGFNTGSLLTSAGILSLVIGLGAQSLISDIIAGVFIVFEGEFRVGDIVTIGDFRGTVLEIGLRTTKIEDTARNIKIFNNSSISGVVNMTKEASIAAIDVSIEYGESIERVEKVLKDEFPKIKKRLPAIMDGPFYMGVSSLSDSSVDLKIIAQCSEKDRLQLARDLNREIFILFGREGINIPFPQVTLSYLKDAAKEATLNERREASEFVKEQKGLAGNAHAEETIVGK